MPHTNISITTGGVAETILAADANRQSLAIAATTEDGWIKFGGTAAVDDGFPVFRNGPQNWNTQDYPQIKEAVSYFSATTAAKIAIVTSAGA